VAEVTKGRLRYDDKMEKVFNKSFKLNENPETSSTLLEILSSFEKGKYFTQKKKLSNVTR
jgi:hypothetical protein